MTENVRDHGAAGDGVTLDTTAVQSAIDACAKGGGGTVLLPAGGTYLVGSIVLRSNMDFRVERGACLAASAREEDYPFTVFDTGAEAGKRLWIKADGEENLRITGGGTIDGRCLDFTTEELAHGYRTVRWRPAMTCFVGCKRLRVDDIILRDAANWALHFSGCDDVVVHGVSILNNLKFPNCDGIDPDHCRNVRISDCHIVAGDDCIVLKNTGPYADYGPTENVTVSGCTLVSTSCAIKIGSESVDDFRNIVFDACTITRSNRGIGLQLRDEGNIEDVLFSNMIVQTRLFSGNWWGVGEPIYVTSLPRTVDTRVGRIRNVRFSNILCRGENGVYIRGCDESRPDEILLDAVRVEIETTRWDAGYQDPRPCQMAVIPDGEPVGEPTPWGQKIRGRNPGIFIAKADRITLRNTEVVWADGLPDVYGPGLHVDDVAGLDASSFREFGTAPGVEKKEIS